jgi:hypothetical protein
MIATAAQPAFVVDHLEAPGEIGLGTMSVNVWIRLGAAHEGAAVGGAAIFVPAGDGKELRVEMRALDGAFDSTIETAIGTIETYKWVTGGDRKYEIRAREKGKEEESRVAKGTIRVRPRLDAIDLLLLDRVGSAHAWSGTGAGGFIAQEATPVGVISGRPRAADWNGDGRLDLIVAINRGEVHVFENLGGGKLEAIHSIACASPAIDAAAGDFDGDGRPDLAAITETSTLEIHFADEDRPKEIGLVPGDAQLLEVADLDEDHDPEIYVAFADAGNNAVQVWNRAGQGTKWHSLYRLPPPPGGRGRIAAILAETPSAKRRARLFIAGSNADQGTLESWGSTADSESRLGTVCLEVTRFAGTLLGLAIGEVAGQDGARVLAAVRHERGAALFAIGKDGIPRRMGSLPVEPRTLALLNLDGDGDDDLVTAGEDLRLWINVRGESFFEAGESPYRIRAPIVALLAEDLDERNP